MEPPWYKYSVRRSIQAFLSEVHQKMHQRATPLETMTWIAEVTASTNFGHLEKQLKVMGNLLMQARSGVDSVLWADTKSRISETNLSNLRYAFARLVAENWQYAFRVRGDGVMVVHDLSLEWVNFGLWKPRYHVGNPSTIGDLRHAKNRIKMCNYSRCRLNTELVPELSIFARQHPGTLRVKSGFSRCPKCKVSYCSQACGNLAHHEGEHRCKTNIYMTDMLNELHNLICYKDETKMEKGKQEEQEVIPEKVIRVTIHDTQPPTWEVDRVKLLALPAACPNLRRAVVQQDLCTGNERLLLLKYEAKNRTFVQSRVCKSILYEWMGPIVEYYRFFAPWWTVEEEEEEESVDEQ